MTVSATDRIPLPDPPNDRAEQVRRLRLAALRSARKREIVDAFWLGFTTEAEIAGYLGMSIHTVHTHIRQIYALVGIHNHAELMLVVGAIKFFG